MNRITIKEIGPVHDVVLDLNKVNIIMGPQSSGKSTIAKIISYCQWVEKRFLLDGEFEYNFEEQFLNFHRISDKYFSKDSLIYYESDYVKITYQGLEYKQTLRKNRKSVEYKKSKNIYIPAERNFVSVIPNLGKYKETNDNIMSFLYDWFDTKKKYSKKNSLPILNLNIDYYHLDDSEADILFLKKEKKEINLRNGSSGLQSIVPLSMLVNYLTSSFYDERKAFSVEELNELKKLLKTNLQGGKKRDSLGIFTTLLESRNKYHYSSFIIEEPEQNLFPETQRDLLYFLLKKCTNKERDHKLVLTTHSPYILYAINNCLMGYVIEKKITTKEKETFLSFGSWIDPKLVSVWEINKNDGTIKSIKDSKTGMINKHYFNQIMNDIMNEYYEMLNYFDDEE